MSLSVPHMRFLAARGPAITHLLPSVYAQGAQRLRAAEDVRQTFLLRY